MKLGALTLSLLFASLMPASALQQLAQSTGRIHGLVLKAGTNDPISGARVTLLLVNPSTGVALSAGSNSSFLNSPIPMPAPSVPAATSPAGLPLPIPAVTTDRDGKFEFNGLETGAYRLAATNAGYVKQEYGQQTFPGRGTLLTLASGEVMKDLTVRLTQTGNVSGRLWDNFGQPAVGVPVQLMKSSYNASGQRVFQSAGSTTTNDRGEYRLYWVTPGKYFLVGGSGLGRPASSAVSPNDPNDNYAVTYYPGVVDPGKATALDVKSGNELAVDFPIAKLQLFRIQGRVIDGVTGRFPASVSMTLAYSVITGGIRTLSFQVPYNQVTGAFEVRDLVPGTYAMQLTGDGSMARVPIDLVNNIDGLTVVLNNGFSIPGRIMIEGQSDLFALQKIRVQLKATTASTINIGTNLLPAPQTNADGTFRLENVMDGEYRISVNPEAGSPDNYSTFYIKEARLGRTDVLNQPLLISSSTPAASSLEILLSTNIGEVDGVVLDEKLQPAAGVQAVLIPERLRDRTDLYRAATTDQNGRFTIRAVTPGDYKLAAWATLESYGYFDTEVLKGAESMAKSIHVTDGSRQSVDVRVIP